MSCTCLWSWVGKRNSISSCTFNSWPFSFPFYKHNGCWRTSWFIWRDVRLPNAWESGIGCLLILRRWTCRMVPCLLIMRYQILPRSAQSSLSYLNDVTKCPKCGKLMCLAVQTYAPINQNSERILFVWCCKDCINDDDGYFLCDFLFHISAGLHVHISLVLNRIRLYQNSHPLQSPHFSMHLAGT